MASRGGHPQSDGSDLTLPEEFREIVRELEPEMPEIGEIAIDEALRDAGAIAAYYLTLSEAGISEKAALRLTRDYAEERLWRATQDGGD